MQDAFIPGTETAYRHSVRDVLLALRTDAEQGLGEEEARARLEHYGRNELETEKPAPPWRKLLAQFGDVLVILLLVAASVSFGLWLIEREAELPYEAIAILAIVLLNAVMGYVQVVRAERAMATLRQMSAAQATVIRGGIRKRIPAAELVPGDIVQLEEGDTVPADARLIHSTTLLASEAALTGESVPVSKTTAALDEAASVADRRNMLFSGTAVTYGHGSAVVTATGMRTEMGRIAGMLKETKDERTPLQKGLDRVGRLLGGIVVFIAIAMVAVILVFEDVHGVRALFDVFILGVALAVAAVPEGLPAIVTAVLSIGVQRMARRNAILRQLAAVETLGSTNVIASDKTGTLTENEMTVRRVVTASGDVEFTGAGYSPEGEVLRHGGGAIEGALRAELVRTLAAADRANNAILERRGDRRWAVQGDPTEAALIVAARKAGLEKEALEARFPRIGEVPFSSERKMMSTIHSDAERDGRLRAFSKGAADVLLSRCTYELVGEETRALSQKRRAEILACNDALAAEALRTLGIAFRSIAMEEFPHQGADEGVEQDLVFLGLIGMIDPPRAEAKPAVVSAREAGIRVVMITGDHPKTAAAIANELGIAASARTVTGVELDQMSDEELDGIVEDVSIFARVNPLHKLRIVRALQRGGAIVAVTGDGVNDAPALKTADIGIAMGITGTGVSKEAADMVLSDDNFATIVAAVEEGRVIFTDIRKFLRYLLSSNIGEVMTMFFGVLLASAIGLAPAGPNGIALPLLATQILWINLITDGPPALALGLDPADAGTMKQPPRPRGEGVITSRMWCDILLVGLVMAAGTLLMLDASLPGGLIEGAGDIHYAQTMAFTTLTLFQLVNVFNARFDERSALSGLFTNMWLIGAVLVSLALQVLVIYLPFLQRAFSTVPLGLYDWLVCATVASSVLWLSELSKLVTRKLDGANAGVRLGGVPPS